MRVKFKSEDLGEFNGTPRLAEARLIKRELGMLPMDFGEALTKGDPDAIGMIIAIMLNRAGTKIRWDQVDGEYGDFDIELTPEEQERVDEAEAEARDPLGKDARNGLRVVDKPGSSDSGQTDPPLTWTGPSPVTPPDSGASSD